MLTANWGVADWANNPEMPPTRWDTLVVIPPDKRISVAEVVYRIAQHAREQDAMLTAPQRARLWPRYRWGRAV
jgi:hypothetical protein